MTCKGFCHSVRPAKHTLRGTSKVRISQTGEFVGPAPGSYRVSAEGAGETAQVIVTVLQESFGPPRRPNASYLSVGRRITPTIATATGRVWMLPATR
jgi:hypothetical protein